MAVLRCDQCLEDRPVEDFPNLKAGMICRSCMTGANMEKADKALAAKAKQLATQLSQVDPSDIGGNVGKVKSILAEIYGNFGGPAGYASHLHWIIMELSNQEKIPASVGHIMVNILKLHHTIEQTEEVVTAREMSDDQLRREQELELAKLFMDASVDPKKRGMLERLLGQQGLALTEADPDAVIDAVARELDSATVAEKSIEDQIAELVDIPRDAI